MKRLTKKYNVITRTTASVGETEYVVKENKFGKAINKLGELEDVLEKFNIGYAAQLDSILTVNRTNTLIDIENKEILELENANLNSELAELKQKAIVPKFERQSHIYGFAYGRIKPYVVIAYLDNTITLCEDVQSNTFEFCNNAYLVETKEEAEQKLAEIKGEKV